MWGEIDSCIKPASSASCEPHNGETEDEDEMDQYASEPSTPTAYVRTFFFLNFFFKPPTFYLISTNHQWPNTLIFLSRFKMKV